MIACNNLVKGITCIIGGFLIHFSLGTFYTFGNMSPYIASYLKYRTSNAWITNGHMVWIFAVMAFFLGVTMSLGGLLAKKIGARITCLIGSWAMSFGTILTYFAIKSNIWAVIVTYGVIFGGGSGITYSVAMATPMKWFPLRKGMVAGMVAAGYGLGSLIFNLIQTKYINPLNVSPNSTNTIEKYFTDQDVLDRVPFCFVIIGTAYAAMQLLGVILLMDPTKRKPSRQVRLANFPLENGGDVKKSLITNDNMNTNENVNMIENKLNPPIPEDFTSLQAIKDCRLWLLWTTFFFNGIVIIIISSLYKSFGQTFISNDRFFSIVGAVAAIFNSGGRIIWGRLLDRMPYRIMMTILTISMSVIMGSFYFCSIITSPVGSQIMYFIWVCMLFFCVAGSFAMFPTITSQTFGSTNLAIIYGFVFMGFAFSGIVGALICSILIGYIRYGGLFVVATVSALISLTVTQFFPQKVEKTDSISNQLT